jgi:hypothetical protein
MPVVGDSLVIKRVRRSVGIVSYGIFRWQRNVDAPAIGLNNYPFTSLRAVDELGRRRCVVFDHFLLALVLKFRSVPALICTSPPSSRLHSKLSLPKKSSSTLARERRTIAISSCNAVCIFAESMIIALLAVSSKIPSAPAACSTRSLCGPSQCQQPNVSGIPPASPCAECKRHLSRLG